MGLCVGLLLWLLLRLPEEVAAGVRDGLAVPVAVGKGVTLGSGVREGLLPKDSVAVIESEGEGVAVPLAEEEGDCVGAAVEDADGVSVAVGEGEGNELQRGSVATSPTGEKMMEDAILFTP